MTNEPNTQTVTEPTIALLPAWEGAVDADQHVKDEMEAYFDARDLEFDAYDMHSEDMHRTPPPVLFQLTDIQNAQAKLNGLLKELKFTLESEGIFDYFASEDVSNLSFTRMKTVMEEQVKINNILIKLTNKQ